jgi:hypothetical protein
LYTETENNIVQIGNQAHLLSRLRADGLSDKLANPVLGEA